MKRSTFLFLTLVLFLGACAAPDQPNINNNQAIKTASARSAQADANLAVARALATEQTRATAQTYHNQAVATADALLSESMAVKNEADQILVDAAREISALNIVQQQDNATVTAQVRATQMIDTAHDTTRVNIFQDALLLIIGLFITALLIIILVFSNRLTQIKADEAEEKVIRLSVENLRNRAMTTDHGILVWLEDDEGTLVPEILPPPQRPIITNPGTFVERDTHVIAPPTDLRRVDPVPDLMEHDPYPEAAADIDPARFLVMFINEAISVSDKSSDTIPSNTRMPHYNPRKWMIATKLLLHNDAIIKEDGKATRILAPYRDLHGLLIAIRHNEMRFDLPVGEEE